MKRFIAALAALSMLVLSCTKEIGTTSKDNTAFVPDDISLNIVVADPDDNATRAYIKSGWSYGDIIKIWFDANTDDNPNLVIRYNSEDKVWVCDKEAVTSSCILDTDGGIAKSVYSDYVAVASVDNYTYDGNTLTLSISNWTFLTKLQVVVTELSGSARNYTLACDRFTPYTGYTVGADAITAAPGSKGAAVSGISNESNSAAFVFADSDLWDTAGKYQFALSSNSHLKYYIADVAIGKPNEKHSKLNSNWKCNDFRSQIYKSF